MARITSSLTIDASVEKVWKNFMDTGRSTQWLTGLESIETLEGKPEEVGSKHQLTFNENGRRQTFIETVTSVDPLKHYAFTLDHQGMGSKVIVYLQEKGSSTILTQQVDFYGKKLMWKLLLPFLKGQMRKRQETDLHQLKDFIESN